MHFEYEILMKIKERPSLYLGQVSLATLDAFLGGYAVRENEVNGNLSHQSLFPGFQRFVSNRFGVTGTQGWARIIEFYSTSQQDGIKIFFELLGEFLEQEATGTV